MMSLKFVALKSVQSVHFLLILFVMLGFVFPQRSILLLHLWFVPALILHWKTNHNVCYLTQLENKIQHKPVPKNELRGGFTEKLYTKIFGKKPTARFLQNLIYAIMAMSWTISLIKISV